MKKRCGLIDAGSSENLVGDLKPIGGDIASIMQDRGEPASLDHGDGDMREHNGQRLCWCRAAIFVDREVEILPVAAKLQHGFQEIVAIQTEEPAGAQDDMTAAGP